MKFKSRAPCAEPEINLIPLIDVLLVVMIFLLLTTSGARLTEMQIQLPEAESAAHQDRPQQIVLTVSAQGQFTVNQSPVGANSVAALVAALTPLARKEALLVIRADAAAQHQSVIHALEAARHSGLSQITFAAQSSASGDSPPATKP